MTFPKFKIYINLLIFIIFFTSQLQSAPLYYYPDSLSYSDTIKQDTIAKVKSAGAEKKDTISVDSIKIKKKWKTHDTYIGGSISWKNQEGHKESDFDFRFGTSITGRLDKIDFKVESQYKSRKESPDDNEQYARINWYHTIYRQIYVLGQGQLERDQLTLEGNRFDYILLQEGIGPGYNLLLKKYGGSRFSVLYNFIQVNFFDSNFPFHIQAFSLYLDNSYNLTKKINFSNWTNIIFWDKNDVGFDMESELVYKLTKALGLGFRHTYFLNGPTLQKNQSSDFRIYIKITI